MNSAADYLNSHSFFKSCRMTRNISWFSAAKKQNTLMDRRLLIRRYQERRWSHCNQKRASKQLNQLGQDCCPNAEVLTTDNSTKTQVANPGTLWGIPYMLPSFQFMFFSKLGTSPAPFEKSRALAFQRRDAMASPAKRAKTGEEPLYRPSGCRMEEPMGV